MSIVDFFKKSDKTVKKITPQQVKKIMVTETDFIILDVRNLDEYKEGHIEGSVLLPLSEIEQKAKTVLKDKEQKIIVHCRSGARSANALSLLSKMGYKNLYDMGGILNWPYEIKR